MISPASYLDHRNQNLWNQVNGAFSIGIDYNSEPNYGFYKIYDQVTIYVPQDPPCIASFSHELLHLFMDMKDVSVSGTLSSTFKRDTLLKLLFQPELADHLGNCADHYKMLPLYLQMGFERDRFVADYYNSKCNEDELVLIEMWYNVSDFTSKQYATEQLLSKFFSIKACPNPAFNYAEKLQRLKTLDHALFDILELFWSKLRDFDISKSDAVYNSYRLFTYPFTEDLKRHLESKFPN
jgi:hypothetical protein